MTTYREGQRVRIEWPDGSAAEGTVEWSNANGWAMPLGDIYVGLDALAAKPTSITVLSEPRPEEPTGRGAVVEAATDPHDLRPRQWIHMGFGDWLTVMDDAREPGGFWTRRERWADLLDPVVLHEGMTP